jgi:hypothetical protein
MAPALTKLMLKMSVSNPSPVPVIMESLSITTVIGALVGSLPVIATVLGIIWYCIAISQSAPVQRRLRARRIAKIRKRRTEQHDIPDDTDLIL